jgi:nicotinate-nucleotide adenylyltransferase
VTPARRRVGLFGGSFDPVHVAHVALAKQALAELALDEVRWLPVGTPWQKARALAPAEHRAAMVELAMAGEPRFALDRTELDRPGPSYTLETVRALHAREPGVAWTLLLGEDQHAGLHTWHDWRELLGLVRLAVAGRPDTERAPHPEVAAAAHESVSLPPMAVSSSEVRARLAQGLPVTGLVPDAVARYIARHHLYAATA